MKICFIPPVISTVISGGINTQISQTAIALEKRGHEITFFNQWEKYNWNQFDMVHIFRADSANFAIAQWLSSNKIPFAISPIFYSSHNPIKLKLAIKYTEFAGKLLSGITSDLHIKKEICQLSSLILPNTTEEGQLICKSMKIDKRKITVIPNGINPFFSEAKPDLFIKKYGIKDFILSTGHFGYKRKNLERLLKASKKINHSIVLIGSLFEDTYSKKCRELIDNSDHITWIDSLNHNDPILASAYAASKVFALPSFYETPGLSALEAALCESNIVITPFGGTKEYFGNFAHYPNPYSVKSIQNSIETALKEQKSSHLAEKILTKYNWGKIAEITESAYSKI